MNALLRTELRLFLREPLVVFFAVAFPSLLVGILGNVPGFHDPQQGIGGRAVADEVVGQPGGEVLGSRGHASTVVPGRGDARRTRGASSGHVAPDGCGTAAVVT